MEKNPFDAPLAAGEPAEHGHLFSDTIERLLGELLAETSPDWNWQRQIASHLHVLPLYGEMATCFAIRSSGELISFELDTPDDNRIETDSRRLRIALYQGSLSHPALRPFVPARPADAVKCPFSNEISEMKVKAGVHNIMCYCGDLEWLTRDELTQVKEF
jgi:hypothetical protein